MRRSPSVVATLAALAAPALLAAAAAPALAAPPAQPRPPAPPPKPAALATCVPVDAAAGSTIDTIAYARGGVAFCAVTTARSCWKLDLGSGAFTPAPVTPAPPPPDAAPGPTAVASADGTARLCKADHTTCTTWAPKQKLALGAAMSTSDDLALVAVVADDGKAVEVFDVATGRRKTKLAAWKTEMGRVLDPPTFIGDRMIAWAHGSPISDVGRIYTLTGKKLGDLGPKDWTLDPSSRWNVGGTRWAFKQLDGATLRVVDVATGKLVKAIDLKPLLYPIPSNDGGLDLAQPADVHADGDTIVYVAEEPSPVIGTIDLATGAVKAFRAPRCP